MKPSLRNKLHKESNDNANYQALVESYQAEEVSRLKKRAEDEKQNEGLSKRMKKRCAEKIKYCIKLKK